MFKKIKIVSACFLFLLGIQSVKATAVFTDIASNHPNYEAINYLYDNGIIEGYEDNTFRPDQLVNRVEALKIILLGSEVLVPEIQEQEIFPDVMHGSWYAKYTVKAKNLGIVKGDDNTGMFRPGDTVNLAEALKMLLETGDISTEYPDSNPYWDVSSDAWFAPYFNYAQSISLLDESSDENVYPATPVTRSMLAELMYRLTLKPEGYTEGQASYYGEAFHGRTTASGDVFDASGFTAAHKTLPFNTWLKVTNLENNEHVYVRINDRGPYVGDRVIDLSKAAFEAISPLSRGVINVSFVPENPPSESSSESSNTNFSASMLSAGIEECPELDSISYISSTAFDNITLEGKIPKVFIEGEVLSLSGTTSSNSSAINAFLVDEDNGQYTYIAENSNGNFEVNVHFNKTGEFKFGILPGQSGSSIVENIEVLSRNCLTETQDNALSSPSGIAIELENGNSVFSWEKNGFNLFKLIFTQNNNTKIYYFYDENEFMPNYPDFVDFNEGSVQVSVQGASYEEDFLAENAEIMWSPEISMSFYATDHYEYIIVDDQADLLSSPKNIEVNKTFNVKIDPKTNIAIDGAVILPNGDVEEVELDGEKDPTVNSNDVEIFSSSNDELTLSYRPTSDELHFAEINNDDGLAVVNIPIYPNNHYPLLPNPVELSDRLPVDLGSNISDLRNEMLQLVNADRGDHNFGSLVLDSNLNSLAQYRSNDMSTNDYFSHYDEEGLTANDLRKNYTISQVVAENIAKDITLELAEYGLMRSAIHRANILNDEWTKVGFGISEYPGGGYIFVQIFSADPLDLNDTNSLRQDILNDVNEIKNVDYSLQSNLNTLGQSWSEKMSDEDFFDFSAPDGSTLVGNIRNSGINASLGTYILGNTSFEDAKEQIIENTQILESNWMNLGIGIDVDEFGVIKITLIYSE